MNTSNIRHECLLFANDSDEIYNLLSEFSVIDTDCGRITFKEWVRSKNGNI